MTDDKRISMLWKVDEAEDLPVAVIEDTEDGIGVCEVGDRTPENFQIARHIVELHNSYLKLQMCL